jgi:hypothetical protein
MSRWIAYSMPPMDHGWSFLPTVEATAVTIASQEAAFMVRGDAAKGIFGVEISIASFLADWEDAKAAAALRGWEGDFRHDPVVLWLPSESGFEYAFAFKQDSNGTSFVVSRRTLPWLEEWI